MNGEMNNTTRKDLIVKKYIFAVIFFFIFAILSVQGYAIFHLNKKMELCESANKEKAISINFETSKPPNSEGDSCLKTESYSKNNKNSGENGDEISCDACGMSTCNPSIECGFQSFDAIKDTVTLLDKSFICKFCGNLVSEDSPSEKVDVTENEKRP